ncbi:hypothetical protein AGLY_012239 [Aphis glycines]|uniref:HAT C-terminal dimerisation domain-containing protein n=1 Tax=Aphis glycines TaxID=307491 RepID=A0A6G0TBQ0_APHGL|nr:hypothetical protein AGLY_012239 [Aphis glycines]
MTKIKNIVEFFKESSEALHKLQNIQKQSGFELLKLIQECKTRWNSAFKMMERIVKLKEPVLSTLAITNNSLNCISDDEWEIISSACTFLQVFDDVTTEMSSENTYFKNLESNGIQSQLIILDPRFKKYGFSSDDRFETYKSQLSGSLLSRQLDPLKWWSSRKQLYSRLYETVKRRRCVPVTSVLSERVFSKAGLVLNSKRTRLTTSNVEKIIFIQSNLEHNNCHGELLNESTRRITAQQQQL